VDADGTSWQNILLGGRHRSAGFTTFALLDNTR